MSLKSFKETTTNKVEMEIVISKQDFENAINKVFKKAQKNISIPGFRKGKATRGLVEKFYGKQVFYEDAINEVLPAEIDADVKETGFKMAAMPEITDVDFEAEEGIVAKVTFTRFPDVKVKKYKGLEVEKVIVKTEDAEVDAELERARKRNSRTIEVTDRPAAKDDTADINYEGFCDGVAFEGGKADGHKLKLGSGTFIPGFEDQVIGKNVGEEFDVNVTFPEEYHAKELAGKPAVFKCKLNALQYEELPALDDEFAKDASEFDTLSEYKADIKSKIEKRHDAEAEARVAEALVKALCENVDVEIPAEMIEKEKENCVREYDYQLRSQGLSLDMILKYTGMTLEDIREKYTDMAVTNVKKQLALDEIVKAEKVEATDEEVEKKYEELAAQFGMKAEDVREYDYQLRSQGLSLDMILKYTGMTLEDIREKYTDMAVTNVKKQLALDEIVKAEKVEATDEEVEKKYEELAAQFGMKAEDVKKRITSEDLAYDVKSIKAFELVKENAKITDKTVTAEEFDKMNAPADVEEKPKKKTTRKPKAETADAKETEEKPAKAVKAATTKAKSTTTKAKTTTAKAKTAKAETAPKAEKKPAKKTTKKAETENK